MAQIGNLGNLIVFEVSSKKVLTFGKMTKAVKGRWTNHAAIGNKPVSEFLGPDQGNVSLSIFLTVNHGVRPRKTIEKIENAIESGTPLSFVIGGKKIGSNRWVITDMSETWDEIIQDGILVSAHLTLNLAEYV